MNRLDYQNESKQNPPRKLESFKERVERYMSPIRKLAKTTAVVMALGTLSLNLSSCNLLNDLIYERYYCSRFFADEIQINSIDINRYPSREGYNTVKVYPEVKRHIFIKKDANGNWSYKVESPLFIQYSYSPPEEPYFYICGRNIDMTYKFELNLDQNVKNTLDRILTNPDQYVGKKVTDLSLLNNLYLNLYYTITVYGNIGEQKMVGPENARVSSHTFNNIFSTPLNIIEENLRLSSNYSIIPTTIKLKVRAIVEEVYIDRVQDNEIVIGLRNTKNWEELKRITGQPYDKYFYRVAPMSIDPLLVEYLYGLTEY
ncbi:MAG: hypothetical protein QXL02_01985 [Candidatus Anstonellales archaeon]